MTMLSDIPNAFSRPVIISDLLVVCPIKQSQSLLIPSRIGSGVKIPREPQRQPSPALDNRKITVEIQYHTSIYCRCIPRTRGLDIAMVGAVKLRFG